MKQAAGFLDVAAGIAAGDIDIHVTGEQAVFVAHHGWTAGYMNGSQLRNRDLPLSAGDRNQYAAECVEAGAKVTHITDVDGIALRTLYGGSDVLASNGTLDDSLSLINAQTIAS